MIPFTSESNPDPKSTSNHDCCTLMKSSSAVHERDFSSEGTAHIAYEEERPTCLTTVAEADSSITADPTAASSENKNTGCCEGMGSNQDNEGVVSSTKCDSIPQSREVTFQSVSILSSLDCYEQAPGEICDVSKEGAVLQGENKIPQGSKSNDLVSSDECGRGNGNKTDGALFHGVCSEGHEDVFCEAVKSNKFVSGESNVVDTRDEPRWRSLQWCCR